MAAMNEIAQAALAAANEAKDIATANRDAQTAGQAKSNELGLGDLPDELLAKIGEVSAAAMMAKLTETFDINPTAPADPTVAGGAPAPAGEPAAPTSPTGDTTPPAGSADPAPPRSKTFAERYLGL